LLRKTTILKADVDVVSPRESTDLQNEDTNESPDLHSHAHIGRSAAAADATFRNDPLPV
jgi:adenylate kinase